MNKLFIALLAVLISSHSTAQTFSPEQFDTGKGKLTISFIGHGTLMFQFDGKTIQVDPWSKLADYALLPKADLILLTHAHGDHLDTEDIPEMVLLKDIDIAFLPVNQPYTMLPEQVVKAVAMFQPKLLYPYHFGETDMSKVVELMKAEPGTKVVVKAMK